MERNAERSIDIYSTKLGDDKIGAFWSLIVHTGNEASAVDWTFKS